MIFMSYSNLNEQIVKRCISWYIFASDINAILQMLQTDEQKIKLLEYFDFLKANKLEITRDVIYAEAVRLSKES